jgi:hypothetical protein
VDGRGPPLSTTTQCCADERAQAEARRSSRVPARRLLGLGRCCASKAASGPAGESPARVGAGASGSRPRFVVERRRTERGVESLLGGSKRAGCDCSLVKATMGEPSRSFHGEGHVCRARSGTRGGSFRGTGSCTRARSGRGTREARLSSLVSKDRSYKPSAKSSGGQRESEGVVVATIGAQKNAPGAKDPRFGRACSGGKR